MDKLAKLKEKADFFGMEVWNRQLYSTKKKDVKLEHAERLYKMANNEYEEAKREHEISEIYAELRAESPHSCSNELMELAEMYYKMGV